MLRFHSLGWGTTGLKLQIVKWKMELMAETREETLD